MRCFSPLCVNLFTFTFGTDWNFWMRRFCLYIQKLSVTTCAISSSLLCFSFLLVLLEWAHRLACCCKFLQAPSFFFSYLPLAALPLAVLSFVNEYTVLHPQPSASDLIAISLNARNKNKEKKEENKKEERIDSIFGHIFLLFSFAK